MFSVFMDPIFVSPNSRFSARRLAFLMMMSKSTALSLYDLTPVTLSEGVLLLVAVWGSDAWNVLPSIVY